MVKFIAHWEFSSVSDMSKKARDPTLHEDCDITEMIIVILSVVQPDGSFYFDLSGQRLMED